jgi:hypothetical protein
VIDHRREYLFDVAYDEIDAETWPELWRAMWSQVEPLIGREDAERTDVFGSSLLVDSSVLPIPV